MMGANCICGLPKLTVLQLEMKRVKLLQQAADLTKAEDEMRARHQVVGDKLASQAAQAQGARLELQQMIASSKQELKALHELGFDMRHPACKVIESDVIGSWMARSKALKQWGCILEQNMWELRKQQAKDEAAMTASFNAYNLDWEVLCLAGLNSDCTSPAAAQLRSHALVLSAEDVEEQGELLQQAVGVTQANPKRRSIMGRAWAKRMVAAVTSWL